LNCAAQKLEKAADWLDIQRGSVRGAAPGDDKVQTVVKDTNKIAEEQLKGLSNQVVKNALFNRASQARQCQPVTP
jgi:hypothetical protein